MTLHKTTTVTSSYRSQVHQKYKSNEQLIKPVGALENDTVSRYGDILSKAHQANKRHASSLFKQLDKDSERARAMMQAKIDNMELFIKDIITLYNQVVSIIVKIEEDMAYQIDQDLQHFLMTKHLNFVAYGIAVRQSLYLEYHTILLRHMLKTTPEETIYEDLFGHKGLFTQLFTIVDQVKLEFDVVPGEDDHFGRIIDTKA